MGKKTRTAMVIVVVIIIALVVAYVAWWRPAHQENLCVCAGPDIEVCQNREALKQLYRSGQLTEYTDLAKMQKRMGWGGWSKSTWE